MYSYDGHALEKIYNLSLLLNVLREGDENHNNICTFITSMPWNYNNPGMDQRIWEAQYEGTSKQR